MSGSFYNEYTRKGLFFKSLDLREYSKENLISILEKLHDFLIKNDVKLSFNQINRVGGILNNFYFNNVIKKSGVIFGGIEEKGNIKTLINLVSNILSGIKQNEDFSLKNDVYENFLEKVISLLYTPIEKPVEESLLDIKNSVDSVMQYGTAVGPM